jgi:hypothetical protein
VAPELQSLDVLGVMRRRRRSFELPLELAAELASSEARGTPLTSAAWQDGHDAVEDLRSVPADAQHLHVGRNPIGLERLHELRSLRALSLSKPTAAALRAAAELPALLALFIDKVKGVDLALLRSAPTLEHVLLAWSYEPIDLRFLADLPRLRTVYLVELKRLAFDSMPRLPRVTALTCAGEMWRKLRLTSLDPIRRLPALRHLSLMWVSVVDGDLDPVAELSQLETLFLPNSFSPEAFARLAAKLPLATGRCLRPVFSEPGDWDRSDACKRCGTEPVSLTGKPALVLCPSCDQARIAKRLERWNAARSA